MVNPLLSDDDKKEKKDSKKGVEPLVKKISNPPAPPKVPAMQSNGENTEKQTADDNSSTSPSSDTVLVSEDEIVAQEENNQEHIAKQIESLTGEIQALESRIERLTGGVSSPSNMSAGASSVISTEPTVQPAGNENLPINISSEKSSKDTNEKSSKEITGQKIDDQANDKKFDSQIKPSSPIPAPPVPPSVAKPPTVAIDMKPATVATPKQTPPISPSITTQTPNAPKPQSAITDIYSKLEKQQKQQLEEIENPKPPSSGGSDIAGTSGEVLIVIGVILMALLLGSPLFIGTLSADFKDLIRIIGWPAVSGCLVIGFILSMFKMGKWVVKIFSLIMMLIGLAITLAVFGNPTFLGPLYSIITPLLDFYQ